MPARYVSALSQLYHLVAFTVRKPKMRLEKAALVVSIDVDVGSKEVGVKNKGKNDANVHEYLSEYSVGEIEERALPLFIDFFNDLEMPVTFAIRGQLTEVDNSIIDLLLKSSVKHDIGSHGYFHKDFTKLSVTNAEIELHKISTGMKRFGVVPESFVFPKGKVAYLSLLDKYGYKCYRGYGNFMNDGMYIEKHDQLYDIHPSFYLGQSFNPIFLNSIIDIAVKNRLPFHVWFHPWNFGKKDESIKRSITKVFHPFFQYAKRKEEGGMLTFETMLSIVEDFEGTRAT